MINNECNDSKKNVESDDKLPIVQIIEVPRKQRNNKLIVAIAIIVCLSVSVYALNVNGFNDYNIPDYLYVHWFDYMKPDGMGGTDNSPTNNNAQSDFPRWSVEYPYRALFLGGYYTGDSTNYTLETYVVYSKSPTINLFTFEYRDGDKVSSQRGRIRALINRDRVGAGKDIRIVSGGIGIDSQSPALLSNFPDVRFDIYNAGINGYFEFDFFYDCADEHQQGAENLIIGGLTGISEVPYDYIIHCANHNGYTGGGESSGGGNGSGGGQVWGGGQYGGGVDWGDDGEPILSGVGDYESRGDIVLDVPDEWTELYAGGVNPYEYPWENNANIPDLSFNVPIPPFTGQGDGDTGYSGGDMPDFSYIPLDDIEFNFTIPSMPNDGDILQIEIPEELYFNNMWPPDYPQ